MTVLKHNNIKSYLGFLWFGLIFGMIFGPLVDAYQEQMPRFLFYISISLLFIVAGIANLTILISMISNFKFKLLFILPLFFFPNIYMVVIFLGPLVYLIYLTYMYGRVIRSSSGPLK